MLVRDVPAHGLVRGNPARLVGFVGKSGHPLQRVISSVDETHVLLRCEQSGEELRVAPGDWARVVGDAGKGARE